MKKTFLNKISDKKIFLLILIFISGCLFLFNSCGLDTAEAFLSPSSTIYIPVATEDSIDYINNYLEFCTNEPSSAATYSTIKYLGTEVYYKIYNSLSVCNSEVSTLENYNQDENTKLQATNLLISSYEPLRCASKNSGDILIPTKYKNQLVYIRLTDYQTDIEDAACIKIDDDYLGGSLASSKPLRYQNDETLSFNFGRYSSEIESGREIYVTGDSDVNTSTTGVSESKKNVWYAALFAVGVARDLNYTLQYSSILYLGTIKIDGDSEDN